ncbi:MAG: class I SAM-dependent methyltransferase [Alphaproteobacteria bacterium]|nr:MAG: class I SAM-dependent methyltransferase [Alphaproteobacteria bacterium]
MKRLRRYDFLAPLYDSIDFSEWLYKRRLRPRLFAGLGGRILDAGIGTGCNVPFYPSEAWMVGTDLSPGMLSRAQRFAARTRRPVALAAMDICNLGFPDGSFDAVISTFVLCTLDEELQRPALAEFARIVRPGGEVRILDYALSRRPLVRSLMKAYQPWEKLVFHGAFDRHTKRYFAPAGLSFVREESYVLDMVRLYVARRPG